jgi:D-alanyl-D-alanine carboxypeptidase
VSAQDRGWGPPCPDSSIVTFEAGGRFFNVHKRVAPIFKAFINELVTREPPPGGYRIDAGAVDDGGYNCRKIAGTDTWSNHAWGLAVDINSNTNLQKHPLTTNMPAWVRDEKLLMRKYGLRWGGTFSTTPDPMHYEFLLTPADADRLARDLEDDMTVDEFVKQMTQPGTKVRIAIHELAGKAVDDKLSTKGSAARVGVKDLTDGSVAGLQQTLRDLHTKLDALQTKVDALG